MKMLKKRLSYLIVFSLLLFSNEVYCNNRAVEHPALSLKALYSGDTGIDRSVNPYIVNIIAIYEINGGRHINEVREYIKWYLDHLNYPDKDGLTGSIYDYEIKKTGEEISTHDYDSVDGYAGTFIYLLNLYHHRTGDDELISENWEKIRDIAYLISHMQDEDCLTRALFNSRDNAKYLMDNCESYAGLKAFNDLAERTGHGRNPYYTGAENGIKKAVLEILYNSEMNNFFWAVDDDVKHPSDWTILYPDAIAQIFPVYFGLLDEDPEKKDVLWREFNRRHGSKATAFPMEQRLVYELAKYKMQDN